MKITAKDATTVTLQPDGEAHPNDVAPTQIVLTFAATPPAYFYGPAAGAERYEIIVQRMT